MKNGKNIELSCKNIEPQVVLRMQLTLECKCPPIIPSGILARQIPGEGDQKAPQASVMLYLLLLTNRTFRLFEGNSAVLTNKIRETTPICDARKGNTSQGRTHGRKLSQCGGFAMAAFSGNKD